MVTKNVRGTYWDQASLELFFSGIFALGSFRVRVSPLSVNLEAES